MENYCRAWVIGGDGRYAYAAEALRRMGLPVKCWGVPGQEDQAGSLTEALTGANIVLLPMRPFEHERLTVAGQQAEAALLPGMLGEAPILIAGSFPAETEAWLQSCGVRCQSFLELESYLLKNAETTAEGAVYLALGQLNRTLRGAKALVIGWGRIGKFLAPKLRALGAEVTVAVRTSEQRTALALLGYSAEWTAEYRRGLGEYDVIFNTVPHPTVTERQAAALSPDCVLIELASLPGGFPEALAADSRLVMARALPGKTAPKTAGENLADAVWACLAGEGRTLE